MNVIVRLSLGISFVAILAFQGIEPRKSAARNFHEMDSTKGLKDYYKDYFPVGISVSPRNLQGDEAHLILQQFNSLTPENVMKPGLIHPEENRFNWGPADEIVNFAQSNGLRVRGHTLCWHQQTGDWFFRDSLGKTVSKEVLLNRLRNHIFQVVGRYKGKVYAWDVVNEVIADDSTKFLRDSPWYTICGEDFIFKAFEYAHQADPEAQLFYNDYNSERPEKRKRIFRLLKQLVNANVPITGVGLQGHWSIYEPSEKELGESIEQFSSLGLKIQITELDVSIYRWEKFQRERTPADSDLFTPTLEQRQLEEYAMAFRVFRKYKNVVTGITFWNVSDRHTWLDSYPVKGRKNYPLLFDQRLKPKRAFGAVVNF
jgi:endo-1,4-beta-xylanase